MALAGSFVQRSEAHFIRSIDVSAIRDQCLDNVECALCSGEKQCSAAFRVCSVDMCPRTEKV